MEAAYAMMEAHDNEMRNHRLTTDTRCEWCKSKIRPSKNDYHGKPKCKTCHRMNAFSYEYQLRKDLYTLVDGKWKKKA